MKFLLVALGGALGALSRLVVSEIMETSENNIFPFPTLLVNQGVSTMAIFYVLISVLGCLWLPPGSVWFYQLVN